MRKKTKIRKKFGRICALVVVGMFVVMTSMSISANDPDDWTLGGDSFGGGGTTQTLGTLSSDSISIIAGGQQGIIIDGSNNPGFVGIGLPHQAFPINRMDVAGGMAVGQGFAGLTSAPSNGMIIQGWVGIGTADPREKLEVAGTVQMTGIKIPTSASNGYVLTSDDYGLGTWQPLPPSIDGGGTANYIAKFTSGMTLGNSIIYENNGKIGIGMTNPQYELDVDGDAHISGELIIGTNSLWFQDAQDRIGSTDEIRMIIDSDGNSDNQFFSVWKDEPRLSSPGSGTELFRIQENGRVGIGTQGPNYKLDVAGGDINIQSPYNYLKDGNIVNSLTPWVTSGSNIYFTGGNVGIGVTSPIDMLDVNGDIRVRGSDIKDAGGTARISLYDNGNLHLREDGGSASLTIDTNGNVGIGIATPNEIFEVSHDGSSHDLVVESGSGEVGIGTINPSQKLEVNGNIQLSDIGDGSGSIYFGAGTYRGVITENPSPYYDAMSISNLRDIQGDSQCDSDLYINTGEKAGKVWIGLNDYEGTSLVLGGNGCASNYRLYVYGSSYNTDNLEVADNVRTYAQPGTYEKIIYMEGSDGGILPKGTLTTEPSKCINPIDTHYRTATD